LREAYAELDRRTPGTRVIAGGTDFMVGVNAGVGLDRIGQVLDVRDVPELRGIAVRGEIVHIGAATTYAELARSGDVPGALAEVAASIPEAVRNRGTVGGNVCSASPRGDLLPLLLAADASLVAGGPRGERAIAVDDFFIAPGKTALAADELILRVEIAARSQVVTRQAAGVRAAVERARPRRIAIGGPVLHRCRWAEAALERGGDLRSALEVDVGGLCGHAADLILPLIQ
jgi:CO/xanthine dehydrogenase FAD-binding subunit